MVELTANDFLQAVNKQGNHFEVDQKGTIIVSNISVTEPVMLKQWPEWQSLQLVDCKLDLLVLQASAIRLSISSGRYKSVTGFWDSLEITDGANIEHVGCADTSCNYLDVKGGSTIERLFIANSQFESISIRSTIVTGIHLERFKIKRLLLRQVSSQQIEIAQSNRDFRTMMTFIEIDGYLRCVNSKLDSLTIGDFKSAPRMHFEDIESNSLVINRVEDASQLAFHDFNLHGEESLLKLDNVQMGTAKFFNCNFYDCERVIIRRDCDIGKINWSGGRWFKNLTSGSIADHKYVCQQIRRAMENQAEKRFAMEFHGRELEYYRRDLTWTKGDWWLLAFYKLSNNYGQDWLRPVLWILVLGLAMYYPIVALNNLEFTGEIFKFGLFLNPAHRVDYNGLKVTDWNNWALAIDSFSRIVFSVMLFQTVRAFRKYAYR